VLRPEITKGKRLRRVPIHKHLIEQGFLKYVEERRKIGKPRSTNRPGREAAREWHKVADSLGAPTPRSPFRHHA
jgi:hypothetical protein